MKKLVTISKRALKLMSIVAFVSFIGSCEQKEMEAFWNDNAAAAITSVSPEAAMVGEEITIEGKYFSSTANNTVSFNGLRGTITEASLMSITAIVPEGAESGNIAVVCDGKVSNLLPYTVIPPIIPTITSIDPITGKVGETVVITGIDFSTTPSENIVKFNGLEATVTESTATSITTSVPAGATSGNVTVTRDEESNGIYFTVKISYTITVKITESEDDVEEGQFNGAMALSSSDLEIGEYDTWDAVSGTDQGVQVIGVRFPGIDIPATASILSANIQFTSDDDGASPRQITIYGENIGNAPVYTEDAYNVSTRERTTANAVWDIPTWTDSGLAGAAQRTSDLLNVVQEIVDRGDWASGNSMNFILLYTGVEIAVGESKEGRQTKSVDDSDGVDVSPILTIIYEMEAK